MSSVTYLKWECKEGGPIEEQAHNKVQILQRNLHHKGQNIIYYI